MNLKCAQCDKTQSGEL